MNQDKPNQRIEEIVREILENSEGHQIDYDLGPDEDGSPMPSKVIPVGWFREWLKIGLIKYGREERKRMAEVVGEDEELIPFHPGYVNDAWKARNNSILERNQLRAEQRLKAQQLLEATHQKESET